MVACEDVLNTCVIALGTSITSLIFSFVSLVKIKKKEEKN